MSLTVLVDAGPWVAVPPPGYGGIESVVATLVPELRAAGARVVLAAVAGSTLEADEHVTTLDGPRLEHIAQPWNRVSGIAHAHAHLVLRALREGLDVDVVHNHVEVVGPAVMAAAGGSVPPTLQTLHWDLAKHAEFYSTFDGGGRVAFAAVSASQLERAPLALRAQTLGVVPLATPAPPPLEQPLEQPAGEHALVLARVCADKGQDVAARVARAAGVPLVLAGPVAGISDPAELAERLADPADPVHAHPDARYWVERVAPLVDGDAVRWVGGVAGARKEELLQGARVLLTPNRWAEPGATGVVEALIRGVPVVGTPLGVLPSLVQDGVTGFLASGEQDLAQALRRVGEIDRDACRAFAQQWSPAGMAAAYLAMYDELRARASGGRA